MEKRYRANRSWPLCCGAIVFLLVAATSSAAPQEPRASKESGIDAKPTTADPAADTLHYQDPSKYLVGAGDILEISVWKEESLTRKVAVRPDGGISFPLIGNLQVAGLRVEQIQNEVTKRLGNFITEPEVTVHVDEVNYKIFVVGKVNKPGEYMTRNPVDVMQALSMAGGLTAFADEGDIVIIRRTKGQVVTYPFDYDEVSSGDELQQNIVLQRGDTVVVP